MTTKLSDLREKLYPLGVEMRFTRKVGYGQIEFRDIDRDKFLFAVHPNDLTNRDEQRFVNDLPEVP